MEVKPKDFELNTKEVAAVLATVVLTGLAVAVALSKIMRNKPNEAADAKHVEKQRKERTNVPDSDPT